MLSVALYAMNKLPVPRHHPRTKSAEPSPMQGSSLEFNRALRHPASPNKRRGDFSISTVTRGPFGVVRVLQKGRSPAFAGGPLIGSPSPPYDGGYQFNTTILS